MPHVFTLTRSGFWCSDSHIVKVKEVKVNFALKQAIKAQRGNRGIATRHPGVLCLSAEA
jgi:hypothetical protein